MPFKIFKKRCNALKTIFKKIKFKSLSLKIKKLVHLKTGFLFLKHGILMCIKINKKLDNTFLFKHLNLSRYTNLLLIINTMSLVFHGNIFTLKFGSIKLSCLNQSTGFINFYHQLIK